MPFLVRCLFVVVEVAQRVPSTSQHQVSNNGAELRRTCRPTCASTSGTCDPRENCIAPGIASEYHHDTHPNTTTIRIHTTTIRMCTIMIAVLSALQGAGRARYYSYQDHRNNCLLHVVRDGHTHPTYGQTVFVGQTHHTYTHTAHSTGCQKFNRGADAHSHRQI